MYDGRGDLPLLPWQFHCNIIVTTSDSKVLLLQRSSGVETAQLEWGVSGGEGMEWYDQKDRDMAGKLHPIRNGLESYWSGDRTS